MFSGLQEDQLKGALEAMLFVTDEPVGTIALADMLEVEPAERGARAGGPARPAGGGEPRHPAARGGRRLAAVRRTRPTTSSSSSYVLSWDTRKLSQAAMETLAIVAYCAARHARRRGQPCAA